MKALALVAWLVLWPFARVIATWWDARAGYRYQLRTLAVVGLLDGAIWLAVGIWLGSKI